MAACSSSSLPLSLEPSDARPFVALLGLATLAWRLRVWPTLGPLAGNLAADSSFFAPTPTRSHRTSLDLCHITSCNSRDNVPVAGTLGASVLSRSLTARVAARRSRPKSLSAGGILPGTAETPRIGGVLEISCQLASDRARTQMASALPGDLVLASDAPPCSKKECQPRGAQ